MYSPSSEPFGGKRSVMSNSSMYSNQNARLSMTKPSVVWMASLTTRAEVTAGTRHVTVVELTKVAGDVKSPPKMHRSMLSSKRKPVIVKMKSARRLDQ